MKAVLPLFIMIDACGWEIVRHDPFLQSVAPHRRRLESVFGYSSTCVPSIVSGGWPDEHRNWAYFVYAPDRSPFAFLRPLRWLPCALTGRRIFRRWLSRAVKWKLGFKGYFDLYNIPFRHISLYDFSEKKSPLRPGGMNCGTNLFDYLQRKRIAHFASDPDVSEDENFSALLRGIEEANIDFAFSYWPGLDGLLHRVGNQSPEVPKRLRMYEEWIDQLLHSARTRYHEVRLYVFSDHGMANCEELLDLRARIDTTGLRMGSDYAVVYDSTMARFWFFHDHARQKIVNCLESVPQGRILPDEELKELRTFFPDRQFGELIFLVKEGVLIVPSHMGERPLRAMHGYHPSEKHSHAAIFSNQSDLPADITAIPHLFRLMVKEAKAGKMRNQEHRNGHARPISISQVTPRKT
jgi:predicted AlkP superfamily pyrophosphatase or phosphodiesterase